MTIRWIAERRHAAVPALVVLVPTLLIAIALLPEPTVPVPSNNDDATRFRLVQRASEALASGILLNVFRSLSADRREHGRRVGRGQGGAASLW